MKTQKINVARKAFYIKSKFANESLEVFGEDHFDFEKIMSTIDWEKLFPNMKLLLVQHEMALYGIAGGYRFLTFKVLDGMAPDYLCDLMHVLFPSKYNLWHNHDSGV